MTFPALNKVIRRNDAIHVENVNGIVKENRTLSDQINANGNRTTAAITVAINKRPPKTPSTSFMFIIYYKVLLKIQVVIYRILGIPLLKVL
jgi:hypothetical protein